VRSQQFKTCLPATRSHHLRYRTATRLRAFLQERYASETIAANFRAYEGKPMTIPEEAAGPKPEYLEWHRREVFGN
jgi:hypothetical protein